MSVSSGPVEVFSSRDAFRLVASRLLCAINLPTLAAFLLCGLWMRARSIRPGVAPWSCLFSDNDQSLAPRLSTGSGPAAGAPVVWGSPLPPLPLLASLGRGRSGALSSPIVSPSMAACVPELFFSLPHQCLRAMLSRPLRWSLSLASVALVVWPRLWLGPWPLRAFLVRRTCPGAYFRAAMPSFHRLPPPLGLLSAVALLPGRCSYEAVFALVPSPEFVIPPLEPLDGYRGSTPGVSLAALAALQLFFLFHSFRPAAPMLGWRRHVL